MTSDSSLLLEAQAGWREDPRAGHPADRLLEDSWTKRQRRAARRELIVETAAAILFLAAAVPMALPGLTATGFDAELALLLVALYAVVAGTIRFPIGAGYLVPTYVILVPMLLLLPPGTAPLLAGTAWLLASIGRWAAGRGRPEHVLFALPNAWHAIGPALVLIVVGAHHGSAASAAVYIAAFLAGCLLDLAISTLREAAALRIAPKVQVRVAAQVGLIDGCVAPLGLLLALAARSHHGALLLVLPLGALLVVLQRDRTQRIAQAQERLELAITDPLTRLGNRRKLAGDLAARIQTATRSEPLVLMVFDLNGFKAYNDMFGHMAGDALLARLGRKLAEVVAPGTAYRLGGDEFCVLMPTQPDAVPAAVAAAAAALSDDGETFSIAASAGAVLLPHEASTPDYALQLADERMYERKANSGPPADREQARDVLVRIMQTKLPRLNHHSTEVSRLAVAAGRRLCMRNEQLDELARAADLHDIGKVGIPDPILAKTGELEPDEWELVHQHTIIGERILSAAPTLRPVARIVRASHERWDGQGYPDGLEGEDIPLAARVVAVCDAYDAIISDRSYRPARSPAAARAELLREAGHQFDPVVVSAVLESLDELQGRGTHDAEAAGRKLVAGGLELVGQNAV